MNEAANMNLSDRIKDYKILELLGQGGYAKVFKALCLTSGVFVAIKMINKGVMMQQYLEKVVRQEVIIHTDLKHPAIVDLYEVFEDMKYVYLVLELACHGDMMSFMKNLGRNMTDSEAAGVMKQVVGGLQYLHSRNIIHRNVSLANLLLMHDRRVKIADFGLATKIAPGECHVTLCGTPNYVSPEVPSGLPQGPPVDVFSVGCVLYELLVGHSPLTTSDGNSVVTPPYHMPSNLSVEAKVLLTFLLQKDPSERISLKGILQHPFMWARSDPAERESKIRLEVPPLNTEHLSATRSTTANIIFHILPTGEVALESVQTPEDYVTLVFRISGDGQKVIVYKPQGGRAPVKMEPPDIPPKGPDSFFTHFNLPKEHWKMYKRAAAFVTLVRTKTPKVTYYSTHAKCHLMITLTDFEAWFEGKTCVTHNAKDGFRLKSASGEMKTESDLTETEKWMLKYSKKCFDQCLKFERDFNNLSMVECFPVVIGRRPKN